MVISESCYASVWNVERTALSRNCFCSLVRGRRRLAEVSDLSASGAGSVLGDSDEVVIDA